MIEGTVCVWCEEIGNHNKIYVDTGDFGMRGPIHVACYELYKEKRWGKRIKIKGKWIEKKEKTK